MKRVLELLSALILLSGILEIDSSRAQDVGTLRFHDGSQYSGQIVDGKANGQGERTFPDGSVYTGGFKDNEFNGKGSYKSSTDIVYKGDFVAGKLDGQVEVIYRNGKYKGAYRNGMRNGAGTFILDPNGYNKSFTGEWKDGEPVAQDGEPFAVIRGLPQNFYLITDKDISDFTLGIDRKLRYFKKNEYEFNHAYCETAEIFQKELRGLWLRNMVGETQGDVNLKCTADIGVRIPCVDRAISLVNSEQLRNALDELAYALDGSRLTYLWTPSGAQEYAIELSSSDDSGGSVSIVDSKIGVLSALCLLADTVSYEEFTKGLAVALE